MRVLAFIALLLLPNAATPQVTLVAPGSIWRFTTQVPPIPDWLEAEFDDGEWSSGAAQLGHGEGDEQTVTHVGAPSEVPITTYFRRLIAFTNEFGPSFATLRFVADDGIVVYLNGAEVYRRNMPPGPPNWLTFASANVEQNENAFVTRGIFYPPLRPGTNIIAVELHQHALGTHDSGFDLDLRIGVVPRNPSIEITNPSSGSEYPPGQPITFTVETSDPEGHVVLVQYFRGTNLLAEVNVEPFTFVWTQPLLGRHRITARAFDQFYWRADSLPVSVQVGEASDETELLRGPYLQAGTTTNMVIR